MSRVANYPIEVPKGVEVTLDASSLKVKGAKGSLSISLDEAVDVKNEEGRLRFVPKRDDAHAHAMAGTLRAHTRNMVQGVSQGFSKKLELQGVGYRAQATSGRLDLQLGFSHPIQYKLPEGIKAETPSQSEIIVSGVDRQLVGQVASEIRSFRPPEPYKGKGVRYADERVVRKEAKKK
ncbi:MAG TPA: 50S ribosomal protein L6 [Pseudomonadales bacterium]|nr:50S ribosomal protein L6 [Pseudomonadales bacterium]